MQKHAVIEHLWDYGRRLKSMFETLAESHGIGQSFKVGGAPCSPWYMTLEKNGANSTGLRTLFSQEMIRNGVLMQWIALSFRHGDTELAATQRAADAAFSVYRKALDEGVERYLEGPAIKPVFRRFN
jgi:glutamate-1-semialdehyde 2,1-aminomutase